MSADHKNKRLKSMDTASTSTLSASSSSTTPTSSALEQMEQRADEMNERAKNAEPFTSTEIDEIMTSIQNILPNNNNSIELDQLRELIQRVGHLPHKEWERTGNSATELRTLLLKHDSDDKKGLTDDFKYMLDRVLTEGNWCQAAEHSSTTTNTSNSKPWAVLVTGVNGIRKTTSVYQSWIVKLLQEALISPEGNDGNKNDNDNLVLPTGENSFFRQLDHMIATLVNDHFSTLYKLTSQSHDFSSSKISTSQPPAEVIASYSKLKAAIFARYRTLSEILGILLIREAMDENLNVMIETSGRDVAMFHYVDSFFPSEKYNKLALHFTVNDLSCAEGSVDRRMVKEMQDGIGVLQSSDDSDDKERVRELIRANAGGPYGSEVLKGVQKDSDNVWETMVVGESATVGKDWYKASIGIDAYSDKDWTAKAIRKDGTEGTMFTFGPPRKL